MDCPTSEIEGKFGLPRPGDNCAAFMTIFSVWHSTIYRYRRPVRFGEHKLLVKQRKTVKVFRMRNEFQPGSKIGDEWTNEEVSLSELRMIPTTRWPVHWSGKPE